MDQGFYHTSQFAEKASVSVRTLRYYDSVGLLCPAEYTEAGYRLYTDSDLSRLQQILALKFLGFSLEEIQPLFACRASELARVTGTTKGDDAGATAAVGHNHCSD